MSNRDLVLASIATRKHATVADIAADCGIEPRDVCRYTLRLYTHGLVERQGRPLVYRLRGVEALDMPTVIEAPVMPKPVVMTIREWAEGAVLLLLGQRTGGLTRKEMEGVLNLNAGQITPVLRSLVNAGTVQRHGALSRDVCRYTLPGDPLTTAVEMCSPIEARMAQHRRRAAGIARVLAVAPGATLCSRTIARRIGVARHQGLRSVFQQLIADGVVVREGRGSAAVYRLAVPQ